jgi:hypothetical protein
MYAPTTAGTSVYAYSPTDLQNATDGIQVSLYGWGYAIGSGMIMSLTNQDGDYIIITMTDYGTEGISPTGDLITTFGYTMPNPPVILDYSGRGFLLCSRFWVNDNSLYTSGTVNMLIGEELVPITSASTNTVYGDYLVCDVTLRLMSSTLKSYPHGVGALVALTNYTEAHPQTLSPVAQYGLYIDNRTVDNNITYGTLDAYATSLLVGLGNFYKKATTWGPLVLAYIPQVGEYYGGLAQPNLSIPPRTSDRVEFTEYTGASAVEYQIVSVTIDCDRMTVTLELGDFEKNVFTSLQQSTNAVNRTLT